MEFKDKFKVGDIIRRGGYTMAGQLVIVRELKEPSYSVMSNQWTYKCEDLFRDDQYWIASKNGDFTLASDEDFVAALSSRIATKEELYTEFGDVEVDIDDNKLFLTQDEYSIILDPKAAVGLRDLINNYVEAANDN